MTCDERTERVARVLASQHSARTGHFIPGREMPPNIVKAFWRRAQAVLREADRTDDRRNETLYCETCGERPAVVITEEVSFCTDCAAAEIDSMASVMCKISDLLE